MNLEKPSISYRQSFESAIGELRNTDEIGFWEEIGSPKSTEDYIHIRQMHSQGQELPAGWIPQTTYWLVENEEVLDETTVRHELNDHLLNVGGQIGYWIRPSERKKGLGKEILRLALRKAKETGIQKVRITCDETNIGSRRIIEANGGELDGSTDMGAGIPRKLLFWINQE